MADRLGDPVAALIRRVAADVVMPRFRNLAAVDIAEKAPGDYVTVADRESEARLSEGLAAIEPGARIVGEEACAADASLLDGIGTGRVWLIDPIDGTGNYAAGRSPFGVMIALVEDGVAQRGWMYDPVIDRFSYAVRGGGAFIDGIRVKARGTGAALPVTALATYFLTEEQRERLTHAAADRLTLVDIPRCAAEQYPRLVLGQNDVALFERTLPWDHAPGTLFLVEAGGQVARTDGSPYRIGDRRTGMLGAATPALWNLAARVLFG